jgi:hypothetical protein
MVWRSADEHPSAHMKQKFLLPQAGSLFFKKQRFFSSIRLDLPR